MDSHQFPTQYQDILDRINSFNPLNYGNTRNYIDGEVSYFSPYISRGVISTKMVMENLLNRGYEFKKIEKFIQELAWRDYWQQVWKHKGDEINKDFKRPQFGVKNWKMPLALIKATTGIHAIDEGIRQLYASGYMHNHLRMYTASIACNLGGSRWKTPAKWMYYHLIDGDWASNALSWQWVAGTFSSKRYYANQENINKYAKTSQTHTFLDVEYANFEGMEVPEVLRDTAIPDLPNHLPETSNNFEVKKGRPTLVYNYYNLDPNWRKDEEANRILLIEPEQFAEYPIGAVAVDFMLNLSQNIPHIQVFRGSFTELQQKLGNSEIYFKEHPLNRHYIGTVDSRDWMFDIEGYFPSFFSFWNRCLKTFSKELVA